MPSFVLPGSLRIAFRKRLELLFPRDVQNRVKGNLSERKPLRNFLYRALEPHRKFSNFLWRCRWWLTGVACLLMFCILNTGTIISKSGVVTDADRLSRFWSSLVLVAMVSVMAAWFIGILRALTQRKVKWFVTLVLMPPIALLYLFLG